MQKYIWFAFFDTVEHCFLCGGEGGVQLVFFSFYIWQDNFIKIIGELEYDFQFNWQVLQTLFLSIDIDWHCGEMNPSWLRC